MIRFCTFPKKRTEKEEEIVLIQKKIEETFKKIPGREKEKIVEEEIRKERLELREVKRNLWKKWRGEKEKEKTHDKQTIQLEKLERILEKAKKEEMLSKERLDREEKRRKKALEERNQREREKKLKEISKIERKEKQKQLQEKWLTLRWITTLIDENSDEWDSKRKERIETERKETEEWKKKTRLEKIKKIKQNNLLNRKISQNIQEFQLSTTPASEMQPQDTPSHMPPPMEQLKTYKLLGFSSRHVVSSFV